MAAVPRVIYFLVLAILSFDQISTIEDRFMHPHPKILKKTAPAVDLDENHQAFWVKNGVDTLKQRIDAPVITNVARNIILFMGDGMSIPTLAATRNYMGGENKQLSFDKFPYTAVSKTYCVDYQVPDSACTATAYLGGVKTNMGVIGVTADVKYGDCQGMTEEANFVNSTAYHAQNLGKATGLVTTTRVTHASPAGVYAHTSDRDWEADTDIQLAGEDPKICTDIAAQLVNGAVGSKLNVIMGGGRKNFKPLGKPDEEGDEGYRTDGADLVKSWLQDRPKAEYVWNKQTLDELNDDTESVLGLFASSHIPYNLDRNAETTPSLTEMTESAIRVLKKNPNGYFLFVEGGRIDMAHHENHVRKALDETAEFAKAIEKALELTNEEDTLIVVTSDHSHTMSFSGYPERGNDVLGMAGTGTDGLPYATLGYANGPGYQELDGEGKRHDLSGDDMGDKNYLYPATVPLDSETHGGDDVLIFARGPWAHLFSGTLEQSVIPYFMSYASCIDEANLGCPKTNDDDDSGAFSFMQKSNFVFLSVVVSFLFLLINY